MARILSFFIFSIALSLFSTSGAHDRAPHGLAYESPVAFSPSAYDFFHPKTQEPNTKDPCVSLAGCSPLPLAAQVASTRAQESQVPASQKGGSRLGAGGVINIVFALAFGVLMAMGVYYVMITRRPNISREISVKPDA